MTNRAQEIYEAAVSYADKSGAQSVSYINVVRDMVWMATPCTFEERREALRLLDARAAGRST